MSQEEKILDDLEATEESTVEIYVRFNEDPEKDYCFQVKSSTRFRELLKIFHTLPIALRPNLFYHRVPIGFRVSTSPGYLTEDGAILFDYEAGDQSSSKVVGLDDKISEKVWPGQLVLPVWEHNDFAFYSVVLAFLAWLYTDLPDFISPTPGICLTNQLSKGLAYLARLVGKGAIARALAGEVAESLSLTAQLVFFAFHLVKVVFIFLFLFTGVFNPVKIFGRSNLNLEITKEMLLSIGWTGSRKATKDEYLEHYRDTRIKEFGSLIEAHKAGFYDKLSNLGANLIDGEGYSTPLGSKTSIKDLLDEDNLHFTLSYDYFSLLGQNFTEYTSNENVNLTDAIKEYRRYGLLRSNATIRKIVDKRKASKPLA